MDLDPSCRVIHFEPEIFGLGMPNGVRDELLSAAQKNLARGRIVDLERRRDRDVNSRIGNTVGELTQRGRQIEAVPMSQLPHDPSHIAQEKLRDGLSILDPRTSVSLCQMTRDLEIQGEGRQVMAQQVV